MDTKKQNKSEKKEEEQIINHVDEQKEFENDLEEKYLQQTEEYKAKYARALADYQNLEKRVREERSEWIKNAGKIILLNLLPVFDTLSLASKHSKDLPAGRQDENLLVSIAQFLDALKAEGVTRIETMGKKFDPAIMDCIQTVEGEEGKVIDEIRAGFMLHDKLLRAAEVTVGKAN
ncbi:MAG TPA: nucleotide exchange factor GrpE [Patescibacteria group bacterium]|nr:nucleotide exchange factor GrpE [Patescibacteria group bacterium]